MRAAVRRGWPLLGERRMRGGLVWRLVLCWFRVLCCVVLCDVYQSREVQNQVRFGVGETRIGERHTPLDDTR